MKVQDIPALNATLNAIATVLMTAGFGCIMLAQRAVDPVQRAAKIRAHRACMLLAGSVSAVFLVGYVTHKILVRGVHTPFGGNGAIAKSITPCCARTSSSRWHRPYLVPAHLPLRGAWQDRAAQGLGALDISHLVLREHHRRARLFLPLSVVAGSGDGFAQCQR